MAQEEGVEDTMEECEDFSGCMWRVGAWSPCSTVCGYGTKTRDVWSAARAFLAASLWQSLRTARGSSRPQCRCSTAPGGMDTDGV